jgi:hypothetical protein
MPRPRERNGRGLVAGQEERHGLVAHLLVVHSAFVALPGGEHQGQEVRPIGTRGPALVDHPVDR